MNLKLCTKCRFRQHLVRRHQIPLHCDRCQVEFENEHDRTIHCRNTPPCEVLPEKAWDGITEAQKTSLAARVSARKSKEESWYIIFEILFPGAPKPRSPYLDPDFADGLFALREFAATEMQGIITQVVNEQSTHISLPFDFDFQSYTEVIVQDAIDILLARFESRMPPEPVVPLTTSIPNVSDSGYSSSPPGGIFTVDTQSAQPSINPTFLFQSIPEGPLDDMFMAYQRDVFGSSGTDAANCLDYSGQDSHSAYGGMFE